MEDESVIDIPEIYSEIKSKSKEIGFTMPSDVYIGTLLKVLISSKPNAHLLELGTGIGLSLSWMIDGMDDFSKLITVDNDPKLITIAKQYFGTNSQVDIICRDASDWIREYKGEKFDLVFADAWPGKYSEIDEILDLIKIGGFYVIDDMKTQPNWPKGHQFHVNTLVSYLKKRDDFNLTEMDWSTGVILAVKIK